MFDPERWSEVMESLLRHRFRTAATALAVIWGMFALVVLLGAGKGLENMVTHEFRDDATNSIWIWRGQTSLPWKGFRVGRWVKLTNADLEAVKALPGVDHISGRFSLWDAVVHFGDKASTFGVRATHPDHQVLEKTKMVTGRFLNDRDVEDRRKVAVIGTQVRDFLFGEGADPIGQWVTVSSVAYLVVGVFDDDGGPDESKLVYIPISTAQRAYGGGDHIHQMMFTIGDATVDESKLMEEKVRQLLADRLDFDPRDQKALRVRNNLEDLSDILSVLGYLRLFVWIVGIGTMTAGVVGTSNILFVSVAERTREFGLRKAIGATPGSIVMLVLVEAVTLASLAGYVGMVLGVGVVEAVRRWLPENEYVRDPSVDLRAVLLALAAITIAGLLAGLFPARRAARIEPIVALRDE
jgi:putative ABC transport system permease protein